MNKIDWPNSEQVCMGLVLVCVGLAWLGVAIGIGLRVWGAIWH